MEVFEVRAAKYNNLAWVSDPEFGRRIVDLAEVDRSAVLLDLAAGTGAISLLFRGRVSHIYALDSSQGMLEQAKEALRNEESVEFVHRSGQDTGLPDQFFDLIICRNGLHHFDNPQLGLREVRRLLKPDGIFILVEPVAPNDEAKAPWSELFRVRDKGRYPQFYYTTAELAGWVAEEGFEVERTEGIVVPLSVTNWIDTGSLTEEESAHILRFVDELPAGLKSRLGVESADGDWVWHHTWALLRLRKSP